MIEEEIEELPKLFVSKHAEKRIRKRVGIPKSSVQSFVDQAHDSGLRSKDFSGSFRKFLDRTYYNNGSADYAISYNNFLVLCKGLTVITCVPVPYKYRKSKPKTNGDKS